LSVLQQPEEIDGYKRTPRHQESIPQKVTYMT